MANSHHDHLFSYADAKCLQGAAPVHGSRLSLLEFSGPLKSSECRQLIKYINTEGVSGNIDEVERLTENVQESPGFPCDIKALTLIYAGSFVSLYKSSAMLHAKELLDKALDLSRHPDCQNRRLLEGMAWTFKAQCFRLEDRYEDAQSLLDGAKDVCLDAAAYGLTSSVCYQQAMILAGQCEGPMTVQVKQKVDQLLTSMIDHGKRCDGYEIQQRTFHGLTRKAMLHLNLFYHIHQCRQERVSNTDPKPSSEDLHLAKDYLEEARLAKSKDNEPKTVYKGTYYLTRSEYYRFSDNYPKAIRNLCHAKKHASKGNCTDLLTSINQRFFLLGSEGNLGEIV